MSLSPTATRLRVSRWLKWLALTALVGALLAGIAWQTRERWLAWAIEAWVVNEPVERADAVFILGGGAQFRSFEAVRLHRDGHASKVLFPHIKPGADEPDAAVSRETILIGKVLDHHAIPADAREEIGQNVTSTRDEIAALRVWADHTQARAVLVPTDPFHTRRLKALARTHFAGSATRVLVTVVDPPGYRWQEWWRDEQGFLAFQNELLKGVLNAFR
jgi:uncharacterized SAM-binding protein YcdF (DUF218 family)